MEEGSMAEYYDQQSWNDPALQPGVADGNDLFDDASATVAPVPVEFRTGAAGNIIGHISQTSWGIGVNEVNIDELFGVEAPNEQ